MLNSQLNLTAPGCWDSKVTQTVRWFSPGWSGQYTSAVATRWHRNVTYLPSGPSNIRSYCMILERGGMISARVALAHHLCLLPLFWKVRDVGVLSVNSSACCPQRARLAGDGLRPISELHRLKRSLLPTTWLQCCAISVRWDGGGGGWWWWWWTQAKKDFSGRVTHGVFGLPSWKTMHLQQ